MPKWRSKLTIFHVTAIMAALLIGAPLLTILWRLFDPVSDTWIHIRTHLLWRTITQTVQLIILVGLLASIFGTFSAYVVVRYEFKGRKLLSWLLIVPLAIPSFIAGYMYADMVSFTGTFTRLLRMFNLSHRFNLMTLTGAAVIFALTLYPYVYLIVRSALSKQSASYSESARTMGLTSIPLFFKVTLPLLRPAIVAGTFLVLLETLNDYGLVNYFNVRVFSFAIFDAWFRLADLNAAIRLSAIMMVMILVLISGERLLRGKRRYTMDVKNRPLARKRLAGWRKVYPSFLWLLLTFALFIPLAQLIYYATLTFQDVWNQRLWFIFVNTMTLALLATSIIVIIALFLANLNRGRFSLKNTLWLRFINLGYAIPGAVIAVAVLISFVQLDRWLFPIYRLISDQAPRLWLTQSIVMLLFAFVLRFMAIGFGNIEATYDKVGEKFTEASYTLGHGKLKTLLKVDVPLLQSGLIAAFIIVFIDVIKELPLTLVLRPTNYETLASLVFVYAREEMIQHTAIPALIIIGLSTLAIYWFTHMKVKGEERHVR